jgi:hypothetical protein
MGLLLFQYSEKNDDFYDYSTSLDLPAQCVFSQRICEEYHKRFPENALAEESLDMGSPLAIRSSIR